MTTPTRFTCYIYEVGRYKKDLGLSIGLQDFDPSKLSLVVNELNEDNFNILDDGQKFRLYVDKLYARVKTSRAFEQEYLSIKDNRTKAKKGLMEVFAAIKKLVKNNTEVEPEQNCYVDWNKIWLNCSEYDLTPGHSYHLEKLYIAFDYVLCYKETFMRSYKLSCEMIDSFIYLCNKCDTFLLLWKYCYGYGKYRCRRIKK